MVDDVASSICVWPLAKILAPGLRVGWVEAGAHTRPLFGSTYAHFVGYVGCMMFPQSIRQGDTGRCDQNGLG
jgi:hypothetical protein